MTVAADTSVQLRGWDFPHVDPNGQRHIDAEWVGRIVQWEHALEMWRMYRSGQFLSIAGIFSEWRDRSTFWPPTEKWTANASLGIGETIARMTEVFEFASRLSRSKAGDESMVVEVTFENMANRLLASDSPNRVPLRGGYRPGASSIKVSRTLVRAELVARARHCSRLLRGGVLLFRLEASPQIVPDIQREIFDRG